VNFDGHSGGIEGIRCCLKIAGPAILKSRSCCVVP
jgi:hypothetical protein